MRFTVHWLAAVAMLLMESGAMAGDGDVEAGKIKTVLCAACHTRACLSFGFSPDFADTSKKPDNGQKRCL